MADPKRCIQALQLYGSTASLLQEQVDILAASAARVGAYYMPCQL